MAKKKYGPEEIALVTSLRKTGETLADICQKTGLKNSTVRYILAQAKIVLASEFKSKNHPKRKLTYEQEEEILRDRKSGMTRDDLCAKYGIKLSYLKTLLSRTNTTIPMETRQENAYHSKIELYPNAMEDMRKGLTPEVIERRNKSIGEAYQDQELRLLKGEQTSNWWNTLSEVDRSAYIEKRTKALTSSEKFKKYHESAYLPGGAREQAYLKKIGFSSFEEKMVALATENEGSFIGPYLGAFEKTKWSCSKGHLFNMRPANVVQEQWCPRCSHVGPSTQELEIKAYVESLVGVENVLGSDREAIKPLELDIYVPSLKLGIEHCGLFSHSDYFGDKVRGRHNKKALACRAAGIDLLMILGDEWINKQDLVKAMIRWRLKKFSGIKLHARKLELRRLEKNKEYSEFFERNHLDGHAKASYAWGLFLGDKLISCASFRTNHAGEFECARLATDYDYSVSGAAGRLFAQIKGPLVSYSNNRLSHGNVYQKLGFELLKENGPSYWYTDFKVRVWRFRCKRINDPEVLARYPDVEHTERAQAAGGVFSEEIFGDNRPLYRIEDAGHRKWLRP
jgi:hypothetical protein